MDLRDKAVLVVGLGRSGMGAARLCLDRGARVTVTDAREDVDVETLAGRATLELGGHRARSFTDTDLIVLSPGVPPLPELDAARAAGVSIVGELELSFRFVDPGARIVAVTGTNGKSTTTSLIGAMLAETGRPFFCGGNLGAPLVEAVGSDAAGPDGLLALELSSFQLETVSTFRAHVAALLNLAEDHLDRYPDFEAYVAAKARVFERQTVDDFAVFPAGDVRCARVASDTKAAPARFSIEKPVVGRGGWIDDDALCVRPHNDGDIERYPRNALRIPGRHNIANALAALVAARAIGASARACLRGLQSFAGLAHRMELVADVDGVAFYNDSKATNVDAVVGSLVGFDRPAVLIAGGKDKGGDYAPLRDVVSEGCRAVVLIGAAAEVMARALEGAAPIHRAPNLADAVALAARLAQTGDAVVLSPACSSYDMFDNFAVRGRVFAEAARALATRA